MATTWASEYMMAEDTVGTLEPGKFADFVVLTQNPHKASPEEIGDISVEMTILGGKVVYPDG